MLYVNEKGEIKLTRGDTAKLNVDVVYGSNDGSIGDPYEMTANDTLTLTVKRSTRDEEYIFQKVNKGSTRFQINPSDTTGKAFGKYKYDVQLTTSAGEVYTIIEPTVFEITQEVTY